MKRVEISDIDFEKGQGLIPVVVQNYLSKAVLTLAYANREALELTVSSGYAHYYRRSWGKVMKKGATSGNVQRVIEILVDCDNDSIVYVVSQLGVACHLGEDSCFHKWLEYSGGDSDKNKLADV